MVSIRSGTSHSIDGANALVRLLQLVMAAVALGIYSEAGSHQEWAEAGYDKEMVTAIAASTLSVLTALEFAVLPFLVIYYYVALGFWWDLILCFIWSAVFASNHKVFGDKWIVEGLKRSYDPKLPGVDALVAAQWFDLLALLLFLASGLMGATCLFMDRRRGRS